MSVTAANGLTLAAATITIPRTGVWHADLDVVGNDVTKLTGKVALSLVDGAATLNGTTIRVESWRGTLRARVVAGAAKLGTQLPAASWRYATARIVLADILAGAGEALSPTADAGLLGTSFQSYTRLAGGAGAALDMLAENLGATWRVLLDGTVWVGRETWPDSKLTADRVVDRMVEDGRATLGVESPSAIPGTTFQGRKIGRVIHRLAGDSLRTDLLFDG